MKLGEIVKTYRLTHGLSMERFAIKAGLSKGYISMLEKGENPRTKKPISPALETIQNIASAMNMDFDHLIGQLDDNQVISLNTATTPKNELLTAITDKVVQLTDPRKEIVLETATEQLEEQQAEEKEKAKIIVLPQPEESYVEEDEELCSYRFIDQPASAGRGAYLLDDTEEETVELPIDINADFVVPVDGDSMEPDYHDGDYIFIKQALYLYDGDIGLFIYNGEGYVKQLIKKGRHHYLHSLNPEYKDMLITEDNDLRIIGKVVGRYNEMDEE